jgi:hypothetical protein
MFRNALFAASASIFLCAGATNAASVIQFYEPYFGGIADNLANAAGVATNGMRWGIVVDTSGNGFSGGGASYDGFASSGTTDGFFGFGGSMSDDYYIAGATTVDATAVFPSGDFGGSTPGFGSIVDDLIVNYANGVSANDSFALVWFDSNSTAVGAKYGFFTHASFVLPTDGNTSSFGTPFQGPDPIRAASNTFAGAIIPEPSRALLLLGGVVGLFLRRRR